MAFTSKVLRRGIVFFLFLFFLAPENIFAAIPAGIENQAIRQFYSGIHFTTTIDKPFPNSSMHFFPNGSDSIQVDVESIRSDGTFAENLPIIVEKPNFVTVSGPMCTGSGSFSLFFSSQKSGTAMITIKLADFPQVRTSFTLNFVPRTSISNRTDTNSFILKQPILFTAQIDPVEARGLKEAKLRYVSTGNFFRIGTKKKEVVVDLKCSTDGLCSAKIPADQTNLVKIRKRTFNYKFFFVDQQNNKFSQSFTGTLNLP